MTKVVKKPDELQLLKNKFSNPYESYKSKEISDIDDAYYWAFQNALDYDEEPSLEDIEESLDRLYDERSEFDDPDEFKKIYGRRGDFVHNGLTKWNDHNKVNPNPRRTDVEVWKDRARKLAKKNPDNAYYNNILQIADDRNGVDHSDMIQEIIDAFGFNRNGEW